MADGPMRFRHEMGTMVLEGETVMPLHRNSTLNPMEDTRDRDQWRDQAVSGHCGC
jgi:hypothetical protein